MSLAALLAALLATAAQAPAPERGEAVVLERVSGKVLVRTDGAYRRLRGPERIPVGSTLDAQEGRVRLTVASDDDGGTWQAVFADGKFTVSQPARGEPIATLTLTGPTFRETCGDASGARRGGRSRRVRRLWGNGHGRFRTSGHYSAATVRGTKWLMEDRCDGTVTRVVRGSVEVEDFTDPVPPAPPEESAPVPDTPSRPAPAPAAGAPGTFVVPAGGSYVARPGS